MYSETEALKRLGVVMTVANLESFALTQGIKKKYKAMTQAEKIALRYDFIMNSAKNSIGDFARTQDSAANQTRIFTESIKEVGSKIGTIILPYFTEAVKILNKLVDRFRVLPSKVQAITIAVSLLVAVIGPLTVGIGMAISAIGTITSALAALSLPIIGVIAGITAITGVVALFGASVLVAAKKSGVLQKAINFLKDVFNIFKIALTGKFIDAVSLVEKRFGVSRTEAWKFVLKIKDLKIAFLELVEKLKKGAKEGFGYLIDYVKRTAGWLHRHREDIFKVIKKVVEMAIKFVESTKKIGSNIMKMIRWGRDFNQNMKNMAKAVRDFVIETVAKMGQLAADAYYWGKNMMDSFINAIKSKISSLKNTIASVPETIKRYMGFSSPTEEGAGKEADKWPINFMNMFIAGLRMKIPSLLQTVSEISAGLKMDNNLSSSFLTNGISKNFGLANGSSSNVVNVNMNYPNFTTQQNTDEIMNNVKETLQDWLNYRRG